MIQPPGQTLLFDADDTLWQNNIYFERAIADFISFLDHRAHSSEQVREHLNTIERQTIAAHGYGLNSFRRSLVQCFENLTASALSEEQHRRILRFVDAIAEQQIELLAGVQEALPQLAARHRLLLVTKGDQQEQVDKLERSGLIRFFAAVEVLREKKTEAYAAIARHHRCVASQTWMIGNSPRSDINPALAAGLNAVFIPHDFTWVLEHEQVVEPPPDVHLIELASFAALLHHF